MVRFWITAALAGTGCMTAAQSILHYTATSGFDHGTREESLVMFEDFAAAIGVMVVDDPDGSQFNSLPSLEQFDVVIFSNTSGDSILDPFQRANFEAFIAGGGSLLGIHAASDTYRHSTANGVNTGTWDFYPELLGGSVQQDPSHVDGTPLYDLSHIGTHPSTANLPDPWSKNEEYYYWDSGYYDPDNIPVLMVEETIGPNDSVNSYDAPRPMSWYRELPEGGRTFYTALGHAVSNYTTDALFQALVRDALYWILGTQIGMMEVTAPVIILSPNPASDRVIIGLPGANGSGELFIADPTGRVAMRQRISGDQVVLDVSALANGPYVIRTKDMITGARLHIAR